ncbi:MAG: hypothetical protein AAF735_04025 [Myxococcota bacterium]
MLFEDSQYLNFLRADSIDDPIVSADQLTDVVRPKFVQMAGSVWLSGECLDALEDFDDETRYFSARRRFRLGASSFLSAAPS